MAGRALAYPYKTWGFGEGMALLGVLRAAEQLGRPAWIDAVAELLAPSLAGPPRPTDHLIAVDVLVELKRLRPAIATDEALRRFQAAVLGASRPVPDRPPVHRPDLPHLATMIWVDCLHTDGPGLVATGHPAAATALVDEAAAVLQDPSGLFSHGYDTATATPNGVHWGRGQGWALHGLLAAGPRLRPRAERLLTALAAHEQDGSWRTIVDDPAAPVEHSVSALIAADTLRDPAWAAMGHRALDAAVAALDADGGLPVSSATPVGPPATYLDRDTGTYPWGQGPLLLALLSARKEETT
ncbi:glycoside hydrolase family 88 protein [Dactylosporangium siamense]|uniref:glycoside hydrolase family 88 protein n=1 Tax=Dactylosporangium siamense TaxID=685454 RepID=UPI0019429737|nr:glycoside hydrolase family 88 protein [Dactylosporangium siamense]